MGRKIANDPSETKNGSPSILKGAGKRSWESLVETGHGGDNQEDGGGGCGSRICTEIPQVGRSSRHKHTPAAGPLAGPREEVA